MLEKPILKKEITIGGRPMTLETGRLAGQAGGAVYVRYGDTVVLVTATMARYIRTGIDFFLSLWIMKRGFMLWVKSLVDS